MRGEAEARELVWYPLLSLASESFCSLSFTFYERHLMPVKVKISENLMYILPYWSILLIPGPDWLIGRREEISVRWSNNCQNYRIIHCHNCYWKHQEAHNGQNILQTFYRQYSTTPVICSTQSARSAQPSQTICNQADFRFLSASIFKFTLLYNFLRRLIADFLCQHWNAMLGVN